MKKNKIEIDLELAESITVNAFAEAFSMFQQMFASHPKNLTLTPEEIYDGLKKAQGKALICNKLAKEILSVICIHKPKDAEDLTPRNLFNIANDIIIESHHDCNECPVDENCTIKNTMLLVNEYRNYEPEIDNKRKQQMVNSLSNMTNPLLKVVLQQLDNLLNLNSKPN